jgi:hypothetical protein
MVNVQAALEELYAVPPTEFTRARNAKVAALAKGGRHDAAEAIRRLRRPTATLWATNQLGRLEPKRLAAFIDSGIALRHIQLRDPRSAGEALQRQRAELEALVNVAQKHLADNGFTATPETLRRISNTLQGAAVDRRLAEDLRHARLTEELGAPGFEVFAGARPRRLSARPRGKAAAATEAHRRGEERRAREDRAREQRVREAEERDRAAREQQAAVQQAQKEIEELAGKLADARRRLSEARRAARATPAAAPRRRRGAA